ncbi:mobilization protein, partial [Klebsiella pneumoniae]|nr:mobilization protein [Klebsiella pneumoniae]
VTRLSQQVANLSRQLQRLSQ